ncbi:MAG: hypothetical protein F2903_00615 [Actinobacteria bacterium]|uniref:Unannotated protein n=1 Tax=freshwater metagenome TaxID=449393 RepID=A0A6J6ZVG3_9ZZZZ|nr:hypothetical protein [Actinomycetota bacterium]MSX09963.1 hypothetical protein [Actinomycetota bacterium]MSX67921.1 hypothetical protein [Actinomycetota bacterium]
MEESPPAPSPAPGHRRRGAHRRARRKRPVLLVSLLVVVLLVAGAGVWFTRNHTSRSQASPSTSSTSSTTTTSTTAPPGPGFTAGKITAVGDSVMIDYQGPLETDLPGVSVDGSVSRQWAQGTALLSQLKASNQLGATVIVGLGTNGEISPAAFDAMMSVLSGASKVIFVNTHVDRPWQDPNNAVLAQGVAKYPNAVLVDWNALATENPSWFGSDGTHLAIGGTGAQALASLIASKAS